MQSQARIERRLIKRDLIKRGIIRGARLDANNGIVEIQAAIRAMHESLKTRDADLAKNWAKAEEDIKNFGKLADETKLALTKIATDGLEVQNRILTLEQSIVKLTTAPANDNRQAYSPGKAFTNDADVKKFLDAGGRIAVKQRFTAPVNTITSLTSGDGGAGDLIVPQRLPGIVEQRFRKLRIRDLLPVGRTSSNSIEFVQETGFTNSAAPVAEGASKPESSLAFDLQTSAVRTIAHYMLASVQILADVPQLQSFIDTRLRIGLAIEEEDQLLAGDGTGQNLLGLIPQATDFDVTRKKVGDTRIDIIRRAMTQLELAIYQPTGIVLHPTDWEDIELTKETGTGAYVWANPRGLLAPTLWGLPVVTSTALTEGEFLLGAFDVAAQIWDRQQATIDVSTEDSDNFRKNLVTIRGEERLALTVYRPESFIYGDFDDIVSS